MTEPPKTPRPPAAWQQPYTDWQTDPSPENLHAVVKTLKPTLGYAVASVGGSDSSVLHSRALIHAAKAVQTYQPDAGSSLPTWVSAQLRSLTRDAREVNSVGHVPERAQLDAVRLSRATQEFSDEHGRDPDVIELADHTGIPVKRIAKVRNYTGKQIVSEEFSADLPTQSPDWDQEAVDYIMHESDHIDRRILEMKTGYGGHPVKEPAEIAQLLKLTPSQLSRRSQRLTYRINAVGQRLKRK